jgi:hypothetical protein
VTVLNRHQQPCNQQHKQAGASNTTHGVVTKPPHTFS